MSEALMDLTPVERMLLEELITRRDAALTPIQSRIDATFAAIAARVDIPVEALKIDLGNGTITDTRVDEAIIAEMNRPTSTEPGAVGK